MEKALTAYCFEHCFNKGKAKGKLILDFECVSTFYHKYLHSIKTVNEALVDEGRVYFSEYVTNSVGAEKRDRFMEETFPIGGHPTG